MANTKSKNPGSRLAHSTEGNPPSANLGYKGKVKSGKLTAREALEKMVKTDKEKGGTRTTSKTFAWLKRKARRG